MSFSIWNALEVPLVMMENNFNFSEPFVIFMYNGVMIGTRPIPAGFSSWIHGIVLLYPDKNALLP